MLVVAGFEKLNPLELVLPKVKPEAVVVVIGPKPELVVVAVEGEPNMKPEA